MNFSFRTSPLRLDIFFFFSFFGGYIEFQHLNRERKWKLCPYGWWIGVIEWCFHFGYPRKQQTKKRNNFSKYSQYFSLFVIFNSSLFVCLGRFGLVWFLASQFFTHSISLHLYLNFFVSLDFQITSFLLLHNSVNILLFCLQKLFVHHVREHFIYCYLVFVV